MSGDRKRSADAAAGRIAAWQRGRMGETLAALLLRLKGYRILARDLRTPVGEIDLIARRGRVLAFVEVKTRGPGVVAGDALPTAAQRRRIVRAAAVFLARRPDLADLDMRFDVILLRRHHWPRHVAAAFRADD